MPISTAGERHHLVRGGGQRRQGHQGPHLGCAPVCALLCAPACALLCASLHPFAPRGTALPGCCCALLRVLALLCATAPAGWRRHPVRARRSTPPLRLRPPAARALTGAHSPLPGAPPACAALAPKAKVLRDGQVSTIEASTLVPGGCWCCSARLAAAPAGPAAVLLPCPDGIASLCFHRPHCYPCASWPQSASPGCPSALDALLPPPPGLPLPPACPAPTGDIVIIRLGDIVPADIKILGEEGGSGRPEDETPLQASRAPGAACRCSAWVDGVGIACVLRGAVGLQAAAWASRRRRRGSSAAAAGWLEAGPGLPRPCGQAGLTAAPPCCLGCSAFPALQCDQAALTGESLPVKKFSGDVAFSGAPSPLHAQFGGRFECPAVCCCRWVWCCRCCDGGWPTSCDAPPCRLHHQAGRAPLRGLRHRHADLLRPRRRAAGLRQPGARGVGDALGRKWIMPRLAGPAWFPALAAARSRIRGPVARRPPSCHARQEPPCTGRHASPGTRTLGLLRCQPTAVVLLCSVLLCPCRRPACRRSRRTPQHANTLSLRFPLFHHCLQEANLQKVMTRIGAMCLVTIGARMPLVQLFCVLATAHRSRAPRHHRCGARLFAGVLLPVIPLRLGGHAALWRCSGRSCGGGVRPGGACQGPSSPAPSYARSKTQHQAPLILLLPLLQACG